MVKEKYYTVKQVADILSFDEQTIYAKIRKNEIPAIKILKKVWISKEWINELIK